MKKQTDSVEVRERPLESSPSGAFEIREAQTPEVEARSDPLRSTYNSTFIILVLSIAAILAVILVFWPSGGF